jgi:hypothetical protein
MQDGQHLGNGAAHRRADDVSGVHSGVVENGHGVIGHLRECLGAEGFVASSRSAIVVGNDAIASREHVSLEIPEMLVGTESLDHQDSRC